MRQEDKLKERYGTDPGFRVPDGYFEELNSRIMAGLTPYPQRDRVAPMSLWQRIKPYAYLAAMFAGIWLMMNVFSRVTTSEPISLDNPPAVIASAMELETDEYIPYITVENDYALEKEVCEGYNSFDDFEKDFGYDLKPEFESIDVPVTSAKEKSV